MRGRVAVFAGVLVALASAGLIVACSDLALRPLDPGDDASSGVIEGPFRPSVTPPLPTTTRAVPVTVAPTTAVPTTTTTTQPPAVPIGSDLEGLSLAFSDEFSGSQLDRSRWEDCFWWDADGCVNDGPNEMAWYTPDSVRVGGGRLRLTARERAFQTMGGRDFDYTSGMVTTGRPHYERDQPSAFAFTYGVVEARVRVPRGQGFWAAIWLLADTHRERPEIDMLEVLGDTPSTYRFNMHWRGANGGRRDQGSDWVGPDLSQDFHVITLEWTPDAVIWSVDGTERWRIDDRASIPDEAMYLIMNLAVGGDWPGPPDESTPFPATFEIDWLRIWTLDGVGQR